MSPSMETPQYPWAISTSAQPISQSVQSLQILSATSVERENFDGVEAD